jgi:nitrogen regulatory protein P-II 1
MKKIECIIQPEKLPALEETLRLAGVSGMTVSEVRGFGNQRIRPEPFLRQKIKIEIYAREDEVEELITTIRAVARSGRMGDGKIVVVPVEQVVRLRTGERGEQAV